MTDQTVKEALELFEGDKSAWHDVYDEAKADMEFYSGNQWDAVDVKNRKASKLPFLTLNTLPQFVHQVTNDIRQNVPQIKVLPQDDKSDVETAKIIQGWIRNIESTSNAPQAYDTAAENQVKSSFGWIRVDHDYLSTDTFEQQPIIRRVVNPLSVIIDSSSIECDGSDAQHGFVTDVLNKAAYRKKYKNASEISFGETKETQDDKLITIAEFFKIDQEDVEIALLQDGTVMELEKALSLRLPVTQTRVIKKNKVSRKKMNGAEVLEETTFPGSYVPLVPVYGEEHWVDGKRNLYSLVRFAKEPQKMLNYWASQEAAMLAKAPQAPFQAAEGQIEGYEDAYANPSTAQVLFYKTKDLDGNPIPPPQRLAPPPVPVGFVNARASAVDDMKRAMGIYDASLGARSNEQSGIAIQARQHQGDTANSHFGDNLNRSICHVGRILISMMPEVIDTPRVLRIISDEDEVQQVGVNGQFTEGQERLYDINVGKYDVTVIAGASYATRRLETQQLMTQIMQANPQLMGVMGDLMFKYSDMPGADVIANRLKKTIPPQLLEGEGDNKEQQIPPQAQAQMQQMVQHIQQDQQVIQQMQQALSDLQQKAQEAEASGTAAEMQKAQSDLQAQKDALKAQEQISALKIQNLEKDLKIEYLEMQQQLAQNPEKPAEEPEVEPQPENGPDPDELLIKKAAMDHQTTLTNALIEAMRTPRQIVRDEQGRVVGVQ